MGMKKAGAVAEPTTDAPVATLIASKVLSEKTEAQAESGAAAAIERLSKPKLEKTTTNPAYKARDYEAEAIGKTRCVQWEAALMSPAIAGMRFDTMEQYLALVKQAADAGVAYSFQK
jgi:hypothetical protein